jgi:hypothetical protein
MQNFDTEDENFGIWGDLGGAWQRLKRLLKKWSLDAQPLKGRLISQG